MAAKTTNLCYVTLSYLNGDFVWPEGGAKVDDQMQPALSVLVAEYRNVDLLLGRRVRTPRRRTTRRRARVS